MHVETELIDTQIKPESREYSQSSQLSNGRVFLFGGHNADYLNDSWIFNFKNKTWTQQFPDISPPPRRLHRMLPLGSDQVLLFGGEGRHIFYDDMWLFDSVNGRWSEIPKTEIRPAPRSYFIWTALNADEILMYGGRDANAVFNDVWVYHVGTNSWEELVLRTALPPLEFAVGRTLSSNRVLLVGTEPSSGQLRAIEYDHQKKNWKLRGEKSFRKPSMRRYFEIVAINSNNYLLLSGFDGKNVIDSWVFQDDQDVWSPVMFSSNELIFHGYSAASLGEDNVLVSYGNQSLIAGNNLSRNWILTLTKN